MKHIKSYNKFDSLNEQGFFKKIFGSKEKPAVPGYRLQNFLKSMMGKKEGGTLYFDDWIIDTIAEPEKGINEPVQKYKVTRAYYYDVKNKKEIDLSKMTRPQIKESYREARIDLIPIDEKGKENKSRFKLVLSISPNDNWVEDEYDNKLYTKGAGEIKVLVIDSLGKIKMTDPQIYPAFESFDLKEVQKTIYDSLIDRLEIDDIFKDFYVEKPKQKADYSMTERPTDNVA
jgi:hypothetical protein